MLLPCLGRVYFPIQISYEEAPLDYLIAIILNCAVRPNTASLFMA